jgi:hypothetical protein
MSYRDDDYSRRDDYRREDYRREEIRREDYRRDDLRREDTRRDDIDYANRRDDERRRIEDENKKNEDFYDGLRTKDHNKALRSILSPELYSKYLEERAKDYPASEEQLPEAPAEKKSPAFDFAQQFASLRLNKASEEELRALVLADLEAGKLLAAIERLKEYFNIETERLERSHLLESVFPLTDYDKRMNRQKLDLIEEILSPILKPSLFGPRLKPSTYVSDLLNQITPADRMDWAFTIGRISLRSRFGLTELDSLIGKIKFGLFDPLQTNLDSFRNELRAHLLISDP